VDAGRTIDNNYYLYYCALLSNSPCDSKQRGLIVNSICALVVLASLLATGPAQATSVNPADVARTYTTIAHATFDDALLQAKNLQKEVQQLLAAPSVKQLEKARAAWITARVPYTQSEVFRFGNPPVDEWEGQVNAWPLDEGMIDYVAKNYHHEMGNIAATANIIANQELKLGTTTLSLTPITAELLADLNELGGSEVNVATGYHAIEFLLWGQDLNGTGPGAGERPHTDFALGKECTNSNCDRRRDYLRAATDLLVKDLEEMVGIWSAKGSYRGELVSKPHETLKIMLFGMGSLALGELGGERMKVALEANSTEDEQDCFSDNTHNAHYYNAKGIANVYNGQYARVDGTVVKGTSLAELTKAKNPALHQRMVTALANTDGALKAMVNAAEDPGKPMKFDQMVAEGNSAGATLIKNSIQALVAETAVIEEIAKTLGISHFAPDNADHSF
jgi:putative iron-regulated protein